MAVTRANAVVGEQVILTITFREDDTGNLFDPYVIEQVDILKADGTSSIETISGGSITKVSLGVYQVTTQAVEHQGLMLDRWMYRFVQAGPIRTAIETTNVAPAPHQVAAVESVVAVPRGSAVVLRPILLTIEFRDDNSGELFDPYQVRQVQILENNGSTVIETITSITRIGLGRYRIQISPVATPKTILDKWYFTVSQGDAERYHIQDTTVYDQSALGAELPEAKEVDEKLYTDRFVTDTEVVMCGDQENIGVSFKDTLDTLVNPASLSLKITTQAGACVIEDVYLPLAERDPNPPRILNPAPGKFEFPFGLDNGSSDKHAKNRTTYRGDYLFTWRASSRAAVRATLTIAPPNPQSTIIWNAVAIGTPGNFITVRYVNPGTPNAVLSLVRSGADITVNLATNNGSAVITTAAQIVAAVAAPNNSTIAQIVTVAFPVGESGSGIVSATAASNLMGGIDASEELVIGQNVKVINSRMFSILQKFRLQIDKAVKLVNEDPDDPCFLGYTDGQLLTYLEGGLQAINAYQPSGTFTFDNYPYDAFGWTLLEASLVAGVMSQSLFAVDTDIPNWSDQGNTFVIQHQPQLVQYLNYLTQRLDKMVPQMKLNFVNSGSLHIEAGPNYRLAQLISAAPGGLFRNMFSVG